MRQAWAWPLMAETLAGTRRRPQEEGCHPPVNYHCGCVRRPTTRTHLGDDTGHFGRPRHCWRSQRGAVDLGNGSQGVGCPMNVHVSSIRGAHRSV